MDRPPPWPYLACLPRSCSGPRPSIQRRLPGRRQPPLGRVHTQFTLWSLFVLYWIALYQYLTGVASRALDTFRPLLDEGRADFSTIKDQLVTLPPSIGLLALALGLAFAALTIASQFQDYGDVVPRTNLVVASDIVVQWFLSATFFCVIFRSLRQLRTVSRLHDQATTIGLLDIQPAHAFSSLTARTAIGIFVSLIFGYLYDSSHFDTAFALASYTVAALFASAVFITPIIGLRGRLGEERAAQLQKMGRLIHIAAEDLHRDVLEKNYREMQQKEAAI